MSSLNGKDEAAAILSKSRLFVIDGEVNCNTLELTKSIAARLLIAGAPDAAVIIDSKGGSVSKGLDVFDILHNYPGHKTAMVYGLASSIAAVILQACDERLCAHHAEIMVHDIGDNISLTTAKDPRKFARFLKKGEKVQLEIDRILNERTGLSPSKIRSISEKGKRLTSEEALKCKLIDRILTKADMAKHFRPEVLERLRKGQH